MFDESLTLSNTYFDIKRLQGLLVLRVPLQLQVLFLGRLRPSLVYVLEM